jgi:hypothetical protein
MGIRGDNIQWSGGLEVVSPVLLKVWRLLGCDAVSLAKYLLTFRRIYCLHPQDQEILTS